MSLDKQGLLSLPTLAAIKYLLNAMYWIAGVIEVINAIKDSEHGVHFCCAILQ